MPTQSNTGKPKSSSKPRPKAPPTPAERARSVAESAVDLPVGAVLEVSDRVADLVEPFSGRGAAERRLKSYRSSLRRTVKRTERRGASARRKATVEARKTRNRVEREARKRQRRVRKAVEDQTTRAQEFLDQLPVVG
jgi:hypothetical protein